MNDFLLLRKHCPRYRLVFRSAELPHLRGSSKVEMYSLGEAEMPAGRQAVCLGDAGLSPRISIRKAVMRRCGGGWSRFEVSCDFALHVPQIRGYLLSYVCVWNI